MAARVRIPKPMIDAQRQVLHLQRSLFERTYRALSDLQEQQHALTDRILSRLPGNAPFDELVDTWRHSADDSRAQYKQAIDESFSALESYLDELGAKGQQAAPPAKKASAASASKSKGTARKKTAKKAKKKATTKKKATRKTKKKVAKKKVAKKKAAKRKTAKRATSKKKASKKVAKKRVAKKRAKKRPNKK